MFKIKYLNSECVLKICYNYPSTLLKFLGKITQLRSAVH